VKMEQIAELAAGRLTRVIEVGSPLVIPHINKIISGQVLEGQNVVHRLLKQFLALLSKPVLSSSSCLLRSYLFHVVALSQRSSLGKQRR